VHASILTVWLAVRDRYVFGAHVDRAFFEAIQQFSREGSPVQWDEDASLEKNLATLRAAGCNVALQLISNDPGLNDGCARTQCLPPLHRPTQAYHVRSRV
jgi:hypothetical protein